ncbi:MAG: hypothetical protein ACRDP5_24155 [Streptosporangiaceae bacterium]
MTQFQSIGEQARWKTVYAILQGKPTDVVITYDELGEALGLDAEADRHAIQMAMRRAGTELEAEDKRAVDSVPNEGYRIVHDPERLGLARQQGKKATRALVRGYSKAANVDLSEIEDPNVRRGLELTAQAFQVQMEFNKRFAVRHEQLEKELQKVAQAQAADVARLNERIERLEREKVAGE